MPAQSLRNRAALTLGEQNEVTKGSSETNTVVRVTPYRCFLSGGYGMPTIRELGVDEAESLLLDAAFPADPFSR
jgi:hypothetical protein